MKIETLAGLGVLAVAAWLLLSGRFGTMGGRPMPSDRELGALIRQLPPDLAQLNSPELAARAERRYLESLGVRTDVGALQGTLAGAQAGAIAGPYGAGIGAGAGFVTSFFI